MIIPVPALWSRQKSTAPLDQIDRVIQNRTHRLMAGIAVNQDFTQIAGALLITVGHGKYLRRRHVFDVVTPIPTAISTACQEFSRREERGLADWLPLMSDLAELESAVVEKVKRHAGKYVDRVMAVAVSDPGVWATDFDGRRTYSSFCDADKLAERCGLTVIDAFPARDIQVGGCGRLLEAIPLWMLAADRAPRVASTFRAVLMAGEISGENGGGFYLPPSDGLDAELPAIRNIDLAGFGFLGRWSQAIEVKTNRRFDALYAEGRTDQELLKKIRETLPVQHGPHKERVIAIQQPELQSSSTFESASATDKKLAAMVETVSAGFSNPPANVVKTLVAAVVDHAAEQLDAGRYGAATVREILVAVPSSLEAPVIHRLQEKFQGQEAVIQTVTSMGVSQATLPAAIAAMLGVLHIDQLPANVPWLTGADSQRILGRITPGRPGNWRQLVRMMADFQPAAMKLKDAM